MWIHKFINDINMDIDIDLGTHTFISVHFYPGTYAVSHVRLGRRRGGGFNPAF